MPTHPILAIVSIACFGTIAATTAPAADPVAIVQEIEAADASVAFMDYVSAGRTIALKPGERLVLGYFASCNEETVTGGSVTVGTTESKVAGGAVVRRKVDCDGGGLSLTGQQTANSGVIVFRKAGGAPSANALARPDVRLYGLSPIVRTDGAGTLIISRVDTPAPPVELTARDGATDLAKRGIALTPGGLYRAELTTADAVRTVLFEVDAFARPGNGPVVSRLLRM
jgi:hypothetical protein